MVRYMTESPDVYVFSRSVDNTGVTVFVNLGAEPQDVVFTGDVPDSDKTMVNFFTAKAEEFPSRLAPGEYRVYVKR